MSTPRCLPAEVAHKVPGDPEKSASKSRPTAVHDAILNELASCHSCLTCAIRFLNAFSNFHELSANLPYRSTLARAIIGHERSLKMFPPMVNKNSDDEAADGKNSAGTSSIMCCPLCEGILQEVSSSSEAALTAIQKERYELKDFHITISSPITLEVSNYSMILHLRDSLDLDFDTDPSELSLMAVKDVFKELVAPSFESALGVRCQSSSRMAFHLNFDNASSRKSIVFLDKFEALPGPKKKKRKRFHRDSDHLNQLKDDFNTKYSLPNVIACIEGTSEEAWKSLAPMPPTSPSQFCGPPKISCHRDSIFIAGRYRKFSRNLSQTPWFLRDEGARKGDTSIEELITKPFKDHFRCDSFKFSAGGREDVDVRMLGSGRPWLVELINARVTSLSAKNAEIMQSEINANAKGLIECLFLRRVGLKAPSILKDAEEGKKKEYSCTVWVSRPINDSDIAHLNSLKDLVLSQKTPIRVLHRRALMDRERTIHFMTAKASEDPHFFHLTLCSQAGTYIKEFVHGDFGRTNPSIGSILSCDADIINLDVEEVKIEWPPAQ